MQSTKQRVTAEQDVSEKRPECIAVPDAFSTRVTWSQCYRRKADYLGPCVRLHKRGMHSHLPPVLPSVASPYPWKPRLASHSCVLRKSEAKQRSRTDTQSHSILRLCTGLLFPVVLGTEPRASSMPSEGPTTETRTQLSLISAKLLPKEESKCG